MGWTIGEQRGGGWKKLYMAAIKLGLFKSTYLYKDNNQQPGNIWSIAVVLGGLYHIPYTLPMIKPLKCKKTRKILLLPQSLN